MPSETHAICGLDVPSWLAGISRAAPVLLLALLASCRQPPPAPGGGVVSLSPALTETLWALGAGEHQIGRSDFCDYPSEVLDLPAVGTSLGPNFEAIARLKPALILGEKGQTSHGEELAKIAGFEQLPWLSVAEMRASILSLGQRFSREQAATELLATLDRGLKVAPPPEGPRVLLLLGGSEAAGPHWFIRRNSVHGAALHAAGARNAVNRDIEGSAALSTEALLDLDPDVIVILTPREDARDLVSAFVELDTLSAVRERRIAVLAGARYLRTGPSVADLAAEIKRLLESMALDSRR